MMPLSGSNNLVTKAFSDTDFRTGFRTHLDPENGLIATFDEAAATDDNGA